MIDFFFLNKYLIFHESLDLPLLTYDTYQVLLSSFVKLRCMKKSFKIYL